MTRDDIDRLVSGLSDQDLELLEQRLNREREKRERQALAVIRREPVAALL